MGHNVTKGQLEESVVNQATGSFVGAGGGGGGIIKWVTL